MAWWLGNHFRRDPDKLKDFFGGNPGSHSTDLGTPCFAMAASIEKGLVDLTPLIHQKIKEADDVIETKKVLPPKWRFGPETMIKGWNPVPPPDDRIPIDTTDGLTWFMEGQIENLHPQVGRHLY